MKFGGKFNVCPFWFNIVVENPGVDVRSCGNAE
jgi:hypothetical protein